MDVTSQERNQNAQTDQYPLLMEQMESHNIHQHIIDVSRNDDASSSSSHDEQPARMDSTQHEDRPSSSTQVPTYQTSLSSSNRLNFRTSSFRRRGDGYGRRRGSPLNSGLWISVELVVTVSQIIASIVVLSLSRNENPQTPLFAWVVGYAFGCVATLPILYWRYRYRNQGTDQDSTQSHQLQGSSHTNTPEPTSYTAISVTQSLDEENIQTSENLSRNNQSGTLSTRCIGYAMPFILCATICCCLPCIISVLGIREDLSQTRGATSESINALPTYKFKLKKKGNVEDQEINTGANEGGVLAVGTDKERDISGEDALCCICLAKYVDDDELRELPCAHVFHVECVDKWLKINALCPLCKSEVGECIVASS